MVHGASLPLSLHSRWCQGEWEKKEEEKKEDVTSHSRPAEVNGSAPSSICCLYVCFASDDTVTVYDTVEV